MSQKLLLISTLYFHSFINNLQSLRTLIFITYYQLIRTISGELIHLLNLSIFPHFLALQVQI